MARKYILTPGGLGDILPHLRQLGLRRRYRGQSMEKDAPCIIEVIPDRVEVLKDEKRS